VPSPVTASPAGTPSSPGAPGPGAVLGMKQLSETTACIWTMNATHLRASVTVSGVNQWWVCAGVVL
jgi:hypothetical protein